MRIWSGQREESCCPDSTDITSPAHSVPLETAAASHYWEHHKTGVSSAVSNQLHQPHFTDNHLASLLTLISLWQQIRTAVRRWVNLSSNHWSSDSCSDMNWAPLTGLWSPQQQGWSLFLIIDVSQPKPGSLQFFLLSFIKCDKIFRFHENTIFESSILLFYLRIIVPFSLNLI